jgi:hypothetical protein
VKLVDQDTREAFQAAREATGRSVLIYKKHYDKSAHLNKYEVGDAVMLRNFRYLDKGIKKMADPYDGPYYVMDILSDVTFRIVKERDLEPKVVHHDRIKPIELKEKPQIDWVFQQSKTYNRQQFAQKGIDPDQLKNVTERLTLLERQLAKSARKVARQSKKKGEKNVTPPLQQQQEQQQQQQHDLIDPNQQPQDQDDVTVEQPPKPKRGRPKKGEKREKVKAPKSPKKGERRSVRIQQRH